MDARLILQKGKNRQTIRLRERETVIGRRHDATLRIPSAEVSRHHCLIVMQEGYLTVEDLDSANGTLVNGAAITGREVLRPGDQLQVGPVTFVVEYQLTQQAIDRLLEGVDDEAVVDAEPASDELPQAELLDEEEATEEAHAAESAEELELEEIENSAEALAALDDAENWNPPEQEYRDLLTNLEEPDEPPRKPKRS